MTKSKFSRIWIFITLAVFSNMGIYHSSYLRLQLSNLFQKANKKKNYNFCQITFLESWLFQTHKSTCTRGRKFGREFLNSFKIFGLLLYPRLTIFNKGGLVSWNIQSCNWELGRRIWENYSLKRGVYY